MSAGLENLRPEAAAFVDEFFADARPLDVLVAPVGAGKSHVASAIAVETLRRGADAVLVASDQTLIARSLAERAAHSGDVTVLPLTREWIWAHGGVDDLPWPSRLIAYATTRAITRPPLDYLMNVRAWDLVILDGGGGRQFNLETARWLEGLPLVRRQLVLLDETAALDEWRRLESARVTNWSQTLAPTAQFGRLEILRVEFERSQDEVALIDAAAAAEAHVSSLGLTGDASSLEAAASSSPIALQAVASQLAAEVRQIRNRLAHGLAPRGASDLVRSGSATASDLAEIGLLADELIELGQRATEVTQDAKLEALARWLSASAQNVAIVVCGFRTTADYVVSRLAEVAPDRHVIALDAGTTVAALDEAGVVVATESRLQGIEIDAATDLFNYDLPDGTTSIYVRVSRLRGGSDGVSPRFAYLRDVARASAREERATQQLEAVLRGL